MNILVIKSTCFKMITACYYAHNASKQIGKDYNKHNRVEFVHPVSKETIVAEAPLPDDNLWRAIAP